jgi:hypothetical protein
MARGGGQAGAIRRSEARWNQTVEIGGCTIGVDERVLAEGAYSGPDEALLAGRALQPQK